MCMSVGKLGLSRVIVDRNTFHAVSLDVILRWLRGSSVVC